MNERPDTGSLSDDNAPVFEIVGEGICHRCVHFHPETVICDAFPEAIPGEILTGEFIHTKPYPGDHGIQFEEKKETGNG